MRPEKSQTGCEGCGARGRFAFSKDSVDYILPGSDTMERATYRLKKDQVIIDNRDHKITLKMLSDGRVLKDLKYGTEFTLKE